MIVEIIHNFHPLVKGSAALSLFCGHYANQVSLHSPHQLLAAEELPRLFPVSVQSLSPDRFTVWIPAIPRPFSSVSFAQFMTLLFSHNCVRATPLHFRAFLFQKSNASTPAAFELYLCIISYFRFILTHYINF